MLFLFYKTPPPFQKDVRGPWHLDMFRDFGLISFVSLSRLSFRVVSLRRVFLLEWDTLRYPSQLVWMGLSRNFDFHNEDVTSF